MKKYPKASELKECPYCKSDEFVVHSNVSGKITFHYKFDGSDADNSEMYTGMSHTPQKFVYCANCWQKIARNDIDY